jgi:acyl-lipid omega-6 desaturase (Delta-12 desaturase)
MLATSVHAINAAREFARLQPAAHEFVQTRHHIESEMPTSQSGTTSTAAAPATSRWAEILSRYRRPHHGRSVLELTITLGPLIALWTLMWVSLGYGYWPSLLLAVPAAGFVVRLFMIQHDCSHGSFFRWRWLNDWTGRAIGVLTLTPFDVWRRTHAMHHATSGNLDRRGMGDVDTLTVREYLALSFLGRLRYRLYRHPLIMFTLGPVYLFFVQHRLPVGLMRRGVGPWLSSMSTNLGIAAVVGGLIWLVGPVPFLLVHLPTMVLAAAIGIWLFYVQHQFHETSWAHDGNWSATEAALYGSSHYDLPHVLRWFTANIGIHHVHHLASRIPFYRLPQVLRDHGELRDVSRLTLVKSFGCIRLALWDEGRRRLIAFRDLRRMRRPT